MYHFDSDLKGKIAVCGNLNPGVPEKKQAEFLPRTMLIAFASGVERIYWYSFRSTERSRFDGEAHFGIVRSNLAPKDAYRAYRTLSELHPAGSSRPELRSDRDALYRQLENARQRSGGGGVEHCRGTGRQAENQKRPAHRRA